VAQHPIIHSVRVPLQRAAEPGPRKPR
jgi:hypothetical protein